MDPNYYFYTWASMQEFIRRQNFLGANFQIDGVETNKGADDKSKTARILDVLKWYLNFLGLYC